MTKLLYILPEYVADAHTHFSYIPALLDRVADSLEISLIVLRGSRPHLPRVKRIMVCSRIPLIRHIELPLYILYARLRGATVAYVHYSFAGAFLAALIFRVTGGRVLYWNCGLPWLYQRSFFRGAFEGLVYMFVSGVVTGTEKLADHYAEQYVLSRKKIHVMPNWIDVEKTKIDAGNDDVLRVRESLGIAQETRLVLFAHRLSERKGAHYLPAIVKRLPRESLLIVLGDGPSRDHVERQIAELGMEYKVRFFGWQPHRTVLKFMRASDVFIMPSDEEGFPHVLLEAMALSIPFVASAVGGVPEILPPGPLSRPIEKGDMTKFSDSIALSLVLPKVIKDAWMQETQQWVMQYDLRQVSKRFIELVSL